jgi:hypothetical protein
MKIKLENCVVCWLDGTFIFVGLKKMIGVKHGKRRKNQRRSKKIA